MNKINALLLLVFMVGCSAAPAPIPDIPPIVVVGAEKPVPIGEMITLTIPKPIFPSSIIDVHYEWKIIDAAGQSKKTWISENNSSVSFGTGATSGKLTAILDATYSYGDNTTKVLSATKSPGISLIDVVVGDPTPVPPTPVPPIPPVPTPDPVPPQVNQLLVSYIYDSNKEMPQSMADMKAALTVGQGLKGLASIRVYDVGQTDVDNLGFRASIQGKSLPVVVFQSQAPTVKIAPIVSVISPTKADEVINEARRLKGVK